MKLAFLRSKISKEQLEKEAAEELEAAMARATPPTESERTWAHAETGEGRNFSPLPEEGLREPVEPYPAPTAPSEASQARAGAVVDVDELRTELWADPEEDETGTAQAGPDDLDDVDLDDVDLDDVPPGGQAPPDVHSRPAPRPAGNKKAATATVARGAKKPAAKRAARKSPGSTRTRGV
ncbi:MAG: hypothetical protein LC733_01535 [Actinobacteria bacterium]|nr:hypothetical protein [Actinomycetota bacterium]